MKQRKEVKEMRGNLGRGMKQKGGGGGYFGRGSLVVRCFLLFLFAHWLPLLLPAPLFICAMLYAKHMGLCWFKPAMHKTSLPCKFSLSKQQAPGRHSLQRIIDQILEK
jgi:hypothetical protein